MHVRFPIPTRPPYCRPLFAVYIHCPTHPSAPLHHSCMQVQSARPNQHRGGAFCQATAIIRHLVHASAHTTTSRDGRKLGSKDSVAWPWLVGVLSNAHARALPRARDVSTSELEVQQRWRIVGALNDFQHVGLVAVQVRQHTAAFFPSCITAKSTEICVATTRCSHSMCYGTM